MKNNNSLHDKLKSDMKANKHILKLLNLTHDQFTIACILSGCD